jgi:hypothetical protein
MHHQEAEMLGKPINVMSDTLIDMLVAILMDNVALTAADVDNVEQIWSELQRRREEERWRFLMVN